MDFRFGEAPAPEPTRIEVAEVPLAAVRHPGVTMQQLQELFDAAFPALGGAIAAGAIVPAGPPLAVYIGDPRETFDLEIAFPVAEPLAQPIERDGVTMVPSTLPPGTAWVLTHEGAYDGLGDAWERLLTGAMGQGAQPLGTSIEVYVTDPTDTGTPLRTDLVLPVVG